MIRKSMLIAVTGAAIGFGLVGCKDDGKTVGEMVGDTTEKAVDKTVQAADNAKDAVVAAFAPSGSSDVTGMRGALEGIVQNALDEGNFKTMTNHFVDSDQKRLEAAPLNTEGLDRNIETFKKAWHDKYDGDIFSAMDSDQVFSNEFVTLMSAQTEGEGKRGKATIKESHGLPQVELPMVAQDGKWRLDIPDDRTAQQYRQALNKAVQDLNANTESWPATANEAYRAVSHRILMALMGEQASKPETN